MTIVFPSADWLNALQEKLNLDAQYGQIARGWEGDILFHIEPSGYLNEPLRLYLDLWHGKCRGVKYDAAAAHPKPAFVLRSPYDNFAAILSGKLNVMTAMMTNKLRVDGSMAYMMRHVPTVLDFVRCAREITTDIM